MKHGILYKVTLFLIRLYKNIYQELKDLFEGGSRKIMVSLSKSEDFEWICQIKLDLSYTGCFFDFERLCLLIKNATCYNLVL